jgi:hypothetical protein
MPSHSEGWGGLFKDEQYRLIRCASRASIRSRFAEQLLLFRPIGLTLRATPPAPAAQTPLLTKEGNVLNHGTNTTLTGAGSGDSAHVLDEHIDSRRDETNGQSWLHGRFNYVLYRRSRLSVRKRTSKTFGKTRLLERITSRFITIFEGGSLFAIMAIPPGCRARR